MTFAMVMNCRDIYKWSNRKVLSADWFTLRDQSHTTLALAPVLVEAASFRMAFFHGMWSSYFLSNSDIYFGARGEESGGYLRNDIINEQDQEIPKPAAILVGREWGDSFDANSPRILTGREYMLLQKSNRVFSLSGVHPLDGPPNYASGEVGMELLPHSSGNLLLELSPRSNMDQTAESWRVSSKVDDGVHFSTTVSGSPPWHIRIPLVANKRNTISLNATGRMTDDVPFPYVVLRLRIEDSP